MAVIDNETARQITWQISMNWPITKYALWWRFWTWNQQSLPSFSLTDHTQIWRTSEQIIVGTSTCIYCSYQQWQTNRFLSCSPGIMIFTTLYSPKGLLWSEDITVWGTLSHVSLNVQSLLGCSRISFFWFHVDLASIVLGDRRLME